ncbi:MAG: hypothetical protein HN352_15585 [Bacteroidetes bacterium]|jgi:HPt (histidine-containing phosphotransfer) domain-containing protein|nr:hypothetical protein [Bacteroidota bacterium]MBT4399491.1 hypothetical protein [Bacteroidota bacterium]MBT4411848.1 hypothetical protein [Bacteroidota bacterium]MBT7462884.1 hypothetical protein [Bacteroidota bacterium]
MDKLYDLEYLDQLADGDESFKNEMIQYFFTNTPKVLDEMKQFLKIEDWVEVRELIHRYIANLNMIGANSIIPVANDLERLAEKELNIEDIPAKWLIIDTFCKELLLELKRDFNSILT